MNPAFFPTFYYERFQIYRKLEELTVNTKNSVTNVLLNSLYPVSVCLSLYPSVQLGFDAFHSKLEFNICLYFFSFEVKFTRHEMRTSYIYRLMSFNKCMHLSSSRPTKMQNTTISFVRNFSLRRYKRSYSVKEIPLLPWTSQFTVSPVSFKTFPILWLQI